MIKGIYPRPCAVCVRYKVIGVTFYKLVGGFCARPREAHQRAQGNILYKYHQRADYRSDASGGDVSNIGYAFCAEVYNLFHDGRHEAKSNCHNHGCATLHTTPVDTLSRHYERHDETHDEVHVLITTEAA